MRVISSSTKRVNDKNPLIEAFIIVEHDYFQVPIYEMGTVSRTLDHIFIGETESTLSYGKCLKTYGRES